MSRIVIAPSFYVECRARSRALLRKIVDAVADDAKTIVPVRTGRLRKSIKGRVMSSSKGRVYARRKYAAYVELGTRYMRAQPYLRPALYRVRVGAGGVR